MYNLFNLSSNKRERVLQIIFPAAFFSTSVAKSNATIAPPSPPAPKKKTLRFKLWARFSLEDGTVCFP